jgi:hypothetical protein
MDIPEKLVIFGRAYDVLEIPPSQLADGVIARASYREGVIYLDESVDPALKLNAIWNGVIQAAQQDLHGRLDEAQAKWTALFVHQFLALNPEIAELYTVDFDQADFFEDDSDGDSEKNETDNGRPPLP